MNIFNIGKCNARISELEKQLGIPASKKLFKIKAANERVDELEALLAAKAPAVKITPQQPPVPAVKLSGLQAVMAGARADIATAKATPAPNFSRQAPAAISNAPEACQVSRAQLEAILKIASPTAKDMPSSWSDESCRVEVERACFQAHLHFAQFMRPEAELEAEYWRASKPTGTRLYLRAEAKRHIEAIISK